MKLTEKTNEIYSYVKENGGRVSMEELVAVTGRTSRSIGANVLDLQKKGLAVREKVAGEAGEDGKATISGLTGEVTMVRLLLLLMLFLPMKVKNLFPLRNN